MSAHGPSDHVLAARLLYEQRLIPEAFGAFETAVGLDSKSADAWLGLGQTRLCMGKPDEAIEALEVALSLGSDPIPTRYLLFVAHFAVAHWDKCFEIASPTDPVEREAYALDFPWLPAWKILLAAPRSVRRRRMAGSLPARLIGKDDLYRFWAFLRISKDPSPATWRQAARAMWETSDRPDTDETLAIALWELAEAREPMVGKAGARGWERYLSGSIARGYAAGAARVADHILDRFPKSADLQLLAGHARFLNGEYESATHHYRLATERDDSHWIARIHAACGQAWAGNPEAAFAESQTTAGKFPDNPIVQYLAALPVSVWNRMPTAVGISGEAGVEGSLMDPAELPDTAGFETLLWPESMRESIHQWVHFRAERKRHREAARSARALFQCVVCGGRGIQHLFQNLASGFRLAHCTECGHIFTNPMPTEEGLRSLYSREYFTDTWSRYLDQVRERVGEGESIPTYPLYENLLSWIERAAPGTDRPSAQGVDRALDVGCANGALMFGLRNRGWKVEGQDITSEYAGFLESMGIPFHACSLAQLPIEEGSLGWISMSHVIEHVSDPAAMVRQLADRLSPGGHLVVMTPCTGTLSAAIGGSAWYYMTEHVQFFTPRSLIRLAERCGLRTVCWRTRLGIKNETPFRNWRDNHFGGSFEKTMENLGQGDVIEAVFRK